MPIAPLAKVSGIVPSPDPDLRLGLEAPAPLLCASDAKGTGKVRLDLPRLVGKADDGNTPFSKTEIRALFGAALVCRSVAG